jgi:hypothetical protein
MHNEPMNNDTRHAAIEVRSFQSYPDSSGAPAVLACGPYVYALDFIAGDVTCHLLKPVSGSRRQGEIAVERCKRTYAAMVAQLGAEWAAANVHLYSDEVAS